MSAVNGFRKVAIAASITLAVAAIHGITPAGPHAWHAVHLAAQMLYFIPILMAAS